MYLGSFYLELSRYEISPCATVKWLLGVIVVFHGLNDLHLCLVLIRPTPVKSVGERRMRDFGWSGTIFSRDAANDGV